MEDKSLGITILIVVISIIISLLFAKTKVTYENGTSENMSFVEAISIIIKKEVN